MLIVQYTKVIYFAVALSLSFALSSLASNGEDPMVTLIPKPQPQALKIPLSLAKMSGTLRNLFSDLGTTDLAVPIPLEGANWIPANRVFASLKKIKERAVTGSSLCFSALKEIVKDSFGDDLTEQGLLEYFQAANYLDIPILFKPVMALWVNKVLGVSGPRKESEHFLTIGADKLSSAPNTASPYIDEYLYWLNAPAYSLRSLNLPVLLSNFRLRNNKLYGVQFGPDNQSSKIVVFNLGATDDTKKIEHSIDLDFKAFDLEIFDNKLYVGNRKHNSVLVFDLKNYEKTGAPIKIDFEPTRLQIDNDKLYVISFETGLIAPIDTSVNIVGQPIYGPKMSYKFVSFGEKIFILSPLEIRVIDTQNNRSYILDIGGGGGPIAISKVGEKLIVIKDSVPPKILVINPETDKVMSDEIKLDPQVKNMLVFGDKLIVNHYNNTISIIDLKSSKIIKKLHGALDSEHFIYGNNLYVFKRNSKDFFVIALPGYYDDMVCESP